METNADNWQEFIFSAVCDGDAAKLQQLLNTTNEQSLDFCCNFSSPLTKAVKAGDYVITEKLLLAGANVNFFHAEGCPGLMLAVQNGNMDICHLLLKHGADVHATEHNGRHTASHYSACHGDLKIAALLLEHGAKIYDPTKSYLKQLSPIRVAVYERQPEMLSFLLEYCKKADVELPLPLIAYDATIAGSEECAITALKKGYYPDSIAIPEGTFFQMAADKGLVKLVSVLVELNPHFLQEDWLILNQLPEKLIAHPDFCDWLVGYRKQPPCLQKLCRSLILSQLVVYYIPKVGELPLPRFLKTYLTAVESGYDWS